MCGSTTRLLTPTNDLLSLFPSALAPHPHTPLLSLPPLTSSSPHPLTPRPLMSQYDSLFSTDEAERIKSEGHPFALPDLWRSSALTDPAVGATLFDLDLNSLPLPSKTSLPLSPQETPLFHIPHELRLPPLPGLNTDANVWPPALLDDPEFRSDPTTALDDDDDENLLSSVVGDYDHSHSHGDEGAYSDVWLDPETVQPPRDPRFFTWDSFLVPGANEPQNGYLTEAGPGVLDVALEARGETGVVVRTDVFCTVRPAPFFCFLARVLLTGVAIVFIAYGTGPEFGVVLVGSEKEVFRACARGLSRFRLYVWHHQEVTTSPPQFRMALTIPVSVIESFAECGTNIKQLELFADSVYGDSR